MMQQVVVSQQTGYARNASESAYPQLWRGLVGWWLPSVNPRGGNRLFDLSPFRNHGTLTNMTNDDWVVSQGAGALDFDGSNDYVDAGDCCDFTSGFMTISAWIKRNETTTAERNIVNKFGAFFGGGSDEDGWGFRIFQNRLQYYAVKDAATHLYQSSVANFNTTDLMHVAAIVESNNGAAAVMYRNGLQLTASWSLLNGNVTLDNNPYSFRISGYTYASVLYGIFSGLIDDIRIYNRALTPAEIRLLASRRGIGLQPRPKQFTYYQFPSGSKRRRLLTGMT